MGLKKLVTLKEYTAFFRSSTHEKNQLKISHKFCHDRTRVYGRCLIFWIINRPCHVRVFKKKADQSLLLVFFFCREEIGGFRKQRHRFHHLLVYRVLVDREHVSFLACL